MTDYKGYKLPLTPEGFKALRELAGITQAEIARTFLVADRSVRRWDSIDTDYRAPDEISKWIIDMWEWVRGQASAIASARPVAVHGYLPVIKAVVAIVEGGGGHISIGASIDGSVEALRPPHEVWEQ